MIACVFVSMLPAVLSAQTRSWTFDLAATTMVEAWDANEHRETVGGVIIGVDRAMWRRLAVRGEGLVARVRQSGNDALLGGITVGTRVRWDAAGTRPFIDVGVGFAKATEPVPMRGTSSNYVALAGAGIEVPLAHGRATLGARWLHLSNNGRAGRARNPDVQALGFIVAIGW